MEIMRAYQHKLSVKCFLRSIESPYAIKTLEIEMIDVGGLKEVSFIMEYLDNDLVKYIHQKYGAN